MNTPFTSVDVANGNVIVDFVGQSGPASRFPLSHEEAWQLHAQLEAALTMLGPRAESPEGGHGQ